MWEQPCDLSAFIIILNFKKIPLKTRNLNHKNVAELKTTSVKNDTYPPKYITTNQPSLLHG